MRITNITVQAGRTFNHPHEQFSNLRPEVTLSAEVDEGDDPIAAVRKLQSQAERLVEDHKNALLNSLEEIHQLQYAERETANLERKLSDMQGRLDRARKYLDERRESTTSMLPARDPVPSVDEADEGVEIY